MGTLTASVPSSLHAVPYELVSLSVLWLKRHSLNECASTGCLYLGKKIFMFQYQSGLNNF